MGCRPGPHVCRFHRGFSGLARSSEFPILNPALQFAPSEVQEERERWEEERQVCLAYPKREAHACIAYEALELRVEELKAGNRLDMIYDTKA